MKTYTIPKGSLIYRGKTYPKGHNDEGMLSSCWISICTDKEVIYTEEDLRVVHKVTASQYYEFNLPEKAKPYAALAAHQSTVIVTPAECDGDREVAER